MPRLVRILVRFCLFQAIALLWVSATESSSKSLPWQKRNAVFSNKDKQLYEKQLPPITFSPAGQLWRVEQAMRTAEKNSEGLMILSLEGDSAFFLISAPGSSSPPYLFQEETAMSGGVGKDPSSAKRGKTSTHSPLLYKPFRPFLLHEVAESIWVLISTPSRTSRIAGQYLLFQRILPLALALRRQYPGSNIAPVLARLLADRAQQATQSMKKSSDVLSSCRVHILERTKDSTVRARIWRIDPNGSYYTCSGVAPNQEELQHRKDWTLGEATDWVSRQSKDPYIMCLPIDETNRKRKIPSLIMD